MKSVDTPQPYQVLGAAAVTKEDSGPRLWTITADAFATGEGRRLYGLITYAEDPKDAVNKFTEEYGSRVGSIAKATEGVSEADIARAIFSEQTLAFCRKQEGNAMIVMLASVYFNFS